MTSRERVLAAVSRNIPDRVPFDLSWGFAPLFYEKFKEKTNRTDPLDYFGADTRLLSIGETQKQADYSKYFQGHADEAKITYGEWGIGNVGLENSDLHFQHIISPLQHAQSVNDIVDYPLPDLLADYRTSHFPQMVQDITSRGLAACAPVTCTLFEIAWQIRGLEEFLMDMFDNPDMTECLLDRLTELRIGLTEKYVSAGADILMLGDDVSMQTGMLVSPTQWRKWFKPRMAKIIDAAKAINPNIPIFYHSDGNPTDIIDELIEIGITILNPVQPECVDPAAIKKQYGDRLAFWGTLGVQQTLPFGTPDDVRREVKTRIETVGAGGGLFLAPSHMIEPEVPWENLVAMCEAIEEYGYYR